MYGQGKTAKVYSEYRRIQNELEDSRVLREKPLCIWGSIYMPADERCTKDAVCDSLCKGHLIDYQAIMTDYYY